MQITDRELKITEFVLRLGVFGTFVGHGIFAFLQNPDWIPFLTFWGISERSALQLMPIIGVADIIIAVVTLIRPLKPLLMYAAVWAFLTALMRPLTDQGILELIERSANWAAPLALYFILRARDETS